jgi:hypothetical protein
MVVKTTSQRSFRAGVLQRINLQQSTQLLWLNLNKEKEFNQEHHWTLFRGHKRPSSVHKLAQLLRSGLYTQIYERACLTTIHHALATESRLGSGPCPKTLPKLSGALIAGKVHVWITSDT